MTGGAEVVVEADDAVDLGAGEVEGEGDLALRRLAHMAKGLLDVVQDGEQRSFAADMAGDDGCQFRIFSKVTHMASESAD